MQKGKMMRIISGKARGTKLFTLDNDNTRPTLDRVKESVFNIIQNIIYESVVLDLFAGSGAIGLEFLSRGAKKAIFCDSSKDAVNIINKNIEKTHLRENAEIYNMDYEKCLKNLTGQKFDIIYLDPPYKTDYIIKALNLIIEFELIDYNSTLIIETDEPERITLEIEKNKDINITNQRKYGRACIFFVKRV